MKPEYYEFTHRVGLKLNKGKSTSLQTIGPDLFDMWTRIVTNYMG